MKIQASLLSVWPCSFGHVQRCMTIVSLGAVVALFLVLCADAARRHAPAPAFAWQSRTACEWFVQARQYPEEGNFQRALHTIRYALAFSPDNTAMLNFQGDMQQSLFEFDDAQQTYQRVLELDPGNRKARENLSLCLRLNRFHRDPESHLSTLYALHRVMLREGRISEAIAVTRRLKGDHALQQATWQTALDQAGLAGKITVDAEGGMSLDLSGCEAPDLARVRAFPITRLNLAGAGIATLEPLAGMPLEQLDLSRTPIEDLGPLRGMPLKILRVPQTGVEDLTPLVACPLCELDISHTRVFDLGPLARLPLAILRATDTPIDDLRAVASLSLRELYVSRSRVRDLGPVSHAPLEVVAIDGTAVYDLTPLKASRLRELHVGDTGVSDLSPLAGMPLTTLGAGGCRLLVDLQPLASCIALERVTLPPRVRNLAALEGLPRLRFIERDALKAEDLMLGRNLPASSSR